MSIVRAGQAASDLADELVKDEKTVKFMNDAARVGAGVLTTTLTGSHTAGAAANSAVKSLSHSHSREVAHFATSVTVPIVMFFALPFLAVGFGIKSLFETSKDK